MCSLEQNISAFYNIITSKKWYSMWVCEYVSMWVYEYVSMWVCEYVIVCDMWVIYLN